MLLLIGGLLFVAVNFIMVTMSSREAIPDNGVERIAISLVAPFQAAVAYTLNSTEKVWQLYFHTVSTAEENTRLKRKLARVEELNNRLQEVELENRRLKKLVNFTRSVDYKFLAAEVIARDPTPFFKTIMIDKGGNDGIEKGMPVLVAEGVVGHTIRVAGRYSRILLITDRNSAVDSLVQESRIRGVVKGDNSEMCYFRYALRKEEIEDGDMIVSSGFDQVFPKGLKVGRVMEVKKGNSQLFQKVIVEPSVDFDKLEEVLVAVNFNEHKDEPKKKE